MDGLTVENEHSGQVRIVNASFKNLTFNYGHAVKASTTNSDIRESEFLGSNEPGKPDSLVFGAKTTLEYVEADLKAGNDFLQFDSNSKSTEGKYDLGTGADKVVFKSNSTVETGNFVDLGVDGDGDQVIVKDGANVEGLTVKNFGSQDSLLIGGQTYNQAYLDDQTNDTFKGIKFEFK